MGRTEKRGEMLSASMQSGVSYNSRMGEQSGHEKALTMRNSFQEFLKLNNFTR